MNTTPLVSILVPCYNVAPYIQECIDSIVSQTYVNLQIVLIDDGSKDETWDILRMNVGKDSRIEIYSQANQGVASTRNNLLKKAKGEYLLFVDGDDWIESEMVTQMTAIAIEYDADITLCKAVTPTSMGDKNTIKIYNNDEIAQEFLYHTKLSGSLWNKLIRKSATNGVCFDSSISYGEDALFCWQILPNINIAIDTNLPLYHYRLNIDSISHQRFDSKKLTGNLVWRKISEECSVRYPKYEQLAKGQLCHQTTMLLFEAARDNFSESEKINQMRNDIRDNYKMAKEYEIGDSMKRVFGLMAVVNWKIAKFIINLIY